MVSSEAVEAAEAEGAKRALDKGKQVAVDGAEVSKVSPVPESGVGLAERNKTFWAGKTQANRNREKGIPLEFFPQVQGADTVDIPLDEWENALAKFEFALVGFVFGSRPYLGRMKGFVKAKWGDESVVKVALLSDGVFLLNFKDKEVMLETLLGGPWTFDNRPLILKKWSEHENYKCGSVSSLPLWVKLPDIRPHISGPRVLARICSRLGKPLCTDGITAEGSSYNYARVCIEMNGDSELADRIEYKDPFGNRYVQRVVYEWRPPRCSNCCNFGHLNQQCPRPNLEQVIEHMRLREIEEAKQKDRREAEDNLDDIEIVEETPMENGKESTEGEEEIEESSTGKSNSETHVEEIEVLKENGNVEDNGKQDFKKYTSRSAQKRAKQREKKMAEAAGSLNSGSQGSSQGGSKQTGEGNSKRQRNNIKSKGIHGKKVGGNTHTYF